jgi:uncharacterized glyoxalase superfamily protein PhnB
MADKVTESLDDFHTIAPHLTVRGAAAAVEFYSKAFGASELYRNLAPDGKSVMHAELISPRQLQKRASEFNAQHAEWVED